jgi:hypothetical protein
MFELGDLGDLGPLKLHGSRPEDRPISDLAPWTLDTVALSTTVMETLHLLNIWYFEVVTNTTKSFTSMLVYIPI